MKPPSHTVYTFTPSPLGRMCLAAAGQHLVGAWFEGQTHWPDLTACEPVTHHPVLQLAAIQLAEYFAKQRTAFELPLDLSAGTAFQQAVWHALLHLTPGQTCSYQSLSQQIGRPKAARAVGAAVGKNPLSIIVPCHRVLGAHGALTGYAGGLDRKTALLRLEGIL